MTRFLLVSGRVVRHYPLPTRLMRRAIGASRRPRRAAVGAHAPAQRCHPAPQEFENVVERLESLVQRLGLRGTGRRAEYPEARSCGGGDEARLQIGWIHAEFVRGGL